MSVSRFLLSLACAAVTAAGVNTAHARDPIRNTASLSYETNSGSHRAVSNTVSLALQAKKPTKISFRRLPRSHSIDYAATKCEPDLLHYTADDITAEELANTPPLMSLSMDSPAIIVLENSGDNHDPQLRETSWITEDSGVRQDRIILRETGPDTGVFAGALPPSAPNTSGIQPECNLTLDHAGMLKFFFWESSFSMGSTASLLIDPYGHVFNSQTGKPVNGATITLIDDMTGSPATMVYGDDGMSAYPNTVISGADVTDASGWVYRMEEGDFRFPLLPPGRYRLQVTPPAGYTSPSKVAAADLAGFDDPHGGPFVISDASYGVSFVLSNPEPLRVDFPIDPAKAVPVAPSSALIVEKTSSVREAEPGDFVQYRIEVYNPNTVAVSNVIIEDALPSALRYRTGTTKGIAEPNIAAHGRALRFSVANLGAGARLRFSYLTEVAPGTPPGEAVNRAIAAASNTPSGIASMAAVRIRPNSFIDVLTVIGRVTEGECGIPQREREGVEGVRLLMEDGTYVVTDADGLYHFEGVRPGTHVVQLDASSISATHAPIACDPDTHRAANPISRFVEGQGGSLQRVDFHLRRTTNAAAARDGLVAEVLIGDAEAAGNRPDWVAIAKPGTGWLFPAADHNPRAPALRVVIAHAPDQRVALRINGEAIDPLSFDGTEQDRNRGVAVSRWTGLRLRDRDNRLEADVLDAKGAVAARLTRIVHYGSAPVRAEYVPGRSRLVVDGLDRPLIAVRITDRDGRPVRAGTMVPFQVNTPYAAAQTDPGQQVREIGGLQQLKSAARVVGDDGLAFIALAPTRQAGQARVTMTFADEQRVQVSEIKAWLSAPARDWVVVGYGRGTLGYDALSRGSERLPMTQRRRIATDGQLALYAKGRIKGAWLLTIAYDSDRSFDRDRGLLGTIDPDRYYTVYGDGTRQGYDAATARKLYLRLERRDFYALYGDFETGLTDTKLGRYSRTMTGAKAEYSGALVHVTAFAANDAGRYGRDEIRGNGLSGPYRLSARDIIPNSEKLKIETRDRFRSEKIVATKALVRHIDYDIDQQAGTIRFREPVLSRDGDLNPVFIVAEYELFSASNKPVAGVRATATLGRAMVGTTVLHDETSGNGTVAAVDARVKLGGRTELRAEAATGGRTGLDDARAYLVEAEHHGGMLDVLAYARQQDLGFGLGQQNLPEAGRRKLGFDGRLRISDRLHVTASAWHERESTGDARRMAGEARLEYRRDHGKLFVGAQFAGDRDVGGEAGNSLLLTAGGTQSLLNGKLELDTQAQVAPSGDDASVDFPARQSLGAKLQLTHDVRLVARHEIAQGASYTAQNTHVGFEVSPWRGGRMMTTLNQGALGENGTRTYAQYGLNQSLPLGEHWTVDASLDSSATLSGGIDPDAVVNPAQPISSGSLGQDGLGGHFIAATLGAAYRADHWSWNARIEYRTSQTEERLGITTNAMRTLGGGNTLAGSLRAYQTREDKGARASSITADLSLAMRPIDSRWSMLERFQLRSDHADASVVANNALAVPSFADGVQATVRAVNDLAVNYQSGEDDRIPGLEANLHHGVKYVRGRYADETVDGLIQFAGLEVRKSIAKHVDVGGAGAVQHTLKNGATAFSLGASIGVSPAKNVWLTAGYNVTGFRDRDFEEARWTRKGAFVSMRVKMDQRSIGEVLRAVR